MTKACTLSKSLALGLCEDEAALCLCLGDGLLLLGDLCLVVGGVAVVAFELLHLKVAELCEDELEAVGAEMSALVEVAACDGEGSACRCRRGDPLRLR